MKSQTRPWKSAAAALPLSAPSLGLLTLFFMACVMTPALAADLVHYDNCYPIAPAFNLTLSWTITGSLIYFKFSVWSLLLPLLLGHSECGRVSLRDIFHLGFHRRLIPPHALPVPCTEAVLVSAIDMLPLAAWIMRISQAGYACIPVRRSHQLQLQDSPMAMSSLTPRPQQTSATTAVFSIFTWGNFCKSMCAPIFAHVARSTSTSRDSVADTTNKTVTFAVMMH